MSQHDMVIDNGPGLTVRTDINAAIQALISQNSGVVEPATKYPGMLWLDTSVAPDGLLRVRDLGNTAWVAAVATVNATGQLTVKTDLVVKAQPAGAIARVAFQDAAGVVRLFVTSDQTANAAIVQTQGSAGGVQQTLSISGSGMALSLGAAAGNVLTTGNAFAGTVGGDTVFAVGQTLLAWLGSQVNRNNVFNATLDTGNVASYTAGGAGAALAGTWRTRGGWLSGGSNYLYLIQRVS